MITILMIIEILIAILLIVVILLQSGKGSELGISFGAGASQTLFGGAGAGNFLTKTTAILAALFFINAFTISMLVSKQRSGSIFSRTPAPIVAPAHPKPQATTQQKGKSTETGANSQQGKTQGSLKGQQTGKEGGK